MRVGLLTASVSRQAGGLFDTVRGLGTNLGARADVEVRVFGLEDGDTHRDLGAWRGISVEAFPVRGIRAFGYAPALLASLRMADLDLLHVHGLWRYPSVASLLWARSFRKPIIISSHGMLDPWAMRRSIWRKRIARWLYEDRHLQSAGCLHAVSAAEAAAVRRFGLRNPVCVIPNAVDLPTEEQGLPPSWHRALPDGAKVLLYLGRIHPKKNLAGLLHGWARVARELRDWWLVIAGWAQDGYEKELRSLALSRAIPRILFVGPQFGVERDAAFRRAEAFVLASHSEGLPLAILEAWAHRLPVIMTPECNAPEGFTAGAAVSIAAGPESIACGLISLLRDTEQRRRAMGAAGRALVEREFTWPVVGRRVLAVYQWLLSRRGLPESVSTASLIE